MTHLGSDRDKVTRQNTCHTITLNSEVIANWGAPYPVSSHRMPSCHTRRRLRAHASTRRAFKRMKTAPPRADLRSLARGFAIDREPIREAPSVVTPDEYDGGQGWDDYEEDEYHDEEDEYHDDEQPDDGDEETLAPFDVYHALRLERDGAREPGEQLRGGGARLRAQFHRLSVALHRDNFRCRSGAAAERAAACRAFRRCELAFSILRDDARRAVYDSHGFDGLVKSEAYQAQSVLESRPGEVFDAFFEGEDPEDREYLLTESLEAGRTEKGVVDDARALLSDVDDAADEGEEDDESDDDDEDDENEDDDDKEDQGEDDEDDEELPPDVIRGCSSRSARDACGDTADQPPLPPFAVGSGLEALLKDGMRGANAASRARFG